MSSRVPCRVCRTVYCRVSQQGHSGQTVGLYRTTGGVKQGDAWGSTQASEQRATGKAAQHSPLALQGSLHTSKDAKAQHKQRLSDIFRQFHILGAK